MAVVGYLRARDSGGDREVPAVALDVAGRASYVITPGERLSDCEEIDGISCSEAVEPVYEYLDGELDDEDAGEVRCHMEKCKRRYPMNDWERMFLQLT